MDHREAPELTIESSVKHTENSLIFHSSQVNATLQFKQSVCVCVCICIKTNMRTKELELAR